MPRTTTYISLDRDLLVILMFQASVNRRTVNEEVEELLYSAVRAQAEGDADDATLAHLDGVYGQIHGHWERQRPADEIANQAPF